jgi:hypothetical protein
MGQKTQFQVRGKQREKRRKFRKKLAALGKKQDEYLYGRFYLKLGEEK